MMAATAEAPAKAVQAVVRQEQGRRVRVPASLGPAVADTTWCGLLFVFLSEFARAHPLVSSSSSHVVSEYGGRVLEQITRAMNAHLTRHVLI